MKPEISIIIPIYNAEIYLKACIDSILIQKFKNFELLLINDGSTDSSYLICNEYAARDTRIRVVHLENRGVSHARNFGIKMARGEKIIFVDSDDTLEKNFFEDIFIKKRELLPFDSIVFGINKIVFNGNNHKTCGDYNIGNNFEETSYIIDHLFKNFMIYNPVNTIYDRNIIISNNLEFNEKLTYGEDTCFNCEYYKFVSSIAVIEECYYNYYFRDESSLSKRFYRDIASIEHLIYKKIIELYKERQIYSHDNELYISKRYIEAIWAGLMRINSNFYNLNICEKYKFIKGIYSNKDFNQLLFNYGKSIVSYKKYIIMKSKSILLILVITFIKKYGENTYASNKKINSNQS